MMQIATDEIVKEVESSIGEFKRHNQDYDEERVKEQVNTSRFPFSALFSWLNHSSFNKRIMFCWSGTRGTGGSKGARMGERACTDPVHNQVERERERELLYVAGQILK